MTPTQLATTLFLAFVLIVVVPVYRSRSQKRKKTPLSPQKDGSIGPSGSGSGDRNGNKSDLLVTASMVTRIVKRYQWFVIMPGYITAEGEKATLSGIIVTRQALIAFKCYGFGGQIVARAGEWQQRINGNIRTLPNLEEDCEKQKMILSKVLELCGLSHIPCRVCAVFTTSGTDLSQAGDSLCFTKDSFASYLQSPEQQEDAGLIPRETGRLLSAYVVRK